MISTLLIVFGYIICLYSIYSLQKEHEAAQELIKTLINSLSELDQANTASQLLIDNLKNQNNLLEQSVTLMEKEIEEIDSEYTQEYDLLKDNVLNSIQQLQVSQELLIQKLNDKNII